MPEQQTRTIMVDDVGNRWVLTVNRHGLIQTEPATPDDDIRITFGDSLEFVSLRPDDAQPNRVE